jgi:UDP-N-acetylglucosamine diphosphorylase / glucose-1-phosphate thymidylyltransferase / UDP-N-acetylgalactosamine diphosphorylase / glucosamine-1-phosphate N-acetyltransferase / galactosamine-1-phosphate N-acetyltransferase
VKKAVILAAGRGTRMGDLTGDLPKPMLPVAGKPILEHVLDRLRAAGFTDACVVTGYRAEIVETHFRDYPMRLTFLRQTVIDGTGSAALLCRDFAGTDPFLFTFGDILVSSADYAGIFDRLTSNPEAQAAAGVKFVDDPFQGAAVYEEGGRVTRIIEKPPKGTSSTNWNSAGLYAFRSAIFDELAHVPLSSRGEYELTSAVEQLLARNALLLLYPIEGAWRDIGRPEDLAAANSTNPSTGGVLNHKRDGNSVR